MTLGRRSSGRLTPIRGDSDLEHLEALVIVGGHLVDQINLPGEVFAHRLLAALTRSMLRMRGLCGPVTRSLSVGSATSTATSLQPICLSHEAVIVARTPSSSVRTTRAFQVAM